MTGAARPEVPAVPGEAILAPSILSADFARLAEELSILDPRRDWVHADVMDHRFVPNLTFGPLLVAAVDRVTAAFIEAHLMVEHPEAMVREFRDAGADQITIHLEACANPGAALATIRASGARAGLAIKPATPLAAAAPWFDAIDALLVMSVEPGFGGQRFMPESLDKLREARTQRERAGLRFLLEVDGGIDPGTAPLVRNAGADVLVAGHAVFGQANPAHALEALRASLPA